MCVGSHVDLDYETDCHDDNDSVAAFNMNDDLGIGMGSPISLGRGQLCHLPPRFLRLTPTSPCCCLVVGGMGHSPTIWAP